MTSTDTSNSESSLQNASRYQRDSRSRKTIPLVAGLIGGIHGVFRGLKAESDAEIEQKRVFCKGTQGWAAWFTGLPGSGKSKLSRLVCDLLESDGIPCERIELDAIRKTYVQHPQYTDAERDFVYEKLADHAAERVQTGINVIIDATAHKRAYREKAREKIDRFIEVMVRCPLSICIERESRRKKGLVAAQMYQRALERKEKGTRFEDLGEVIGVDIPYEENPDAEIIVDSSKGSAPENANAVKDALLRYLNTR
jgi:adenylylsulfate kinase